MTDKIVNRYRIVTERLPQRHKWARWRWALERERIGAKDEWTLERDGTAWTREGAIRSARSRMNLVSFDAYREEQVVFLARAYEPRPVVPSPLPAELSEGVTR